MDTTATRAQLSDTSLDAMRYFADLARGLTWRETPRRYTVQSLHAKGLIEGEDLTTARLTQVGRDVLGSYAQEHCRWGLRWFEVKRRGGLSDTDINDPGIDWKCGAPTWIHETPIGKRRVDTPYCETHAREFGDSDRGPRGD